MYLVTCTLTDGATYPFVACAPSPETAIDAVKEHCRDTRNADLANHGAWAWKVEELPYGTVIRQPSYRKLLPAIAENDRVFK